MSDLSEFLLARIAEDESVALAASTAHPAPWTGPPHRQEWMDDEDWQQIQDEADASGRGDLMDGSGEQLAYDEGVLGAAAAGHIARHDPARVLAECEAKRRIVAPWECGQDEDDWRYGVNSEAHGYVLRLLALPYANHPDYRDEWRP